MKKRGKELIIKIYSKIKPLMTRGIGLCIRPFEKDKKYIVMIDGGICSQIDQYLLGMFLASLGCQVEYDLSWYTEYGMDMYGEQVRNFDLLKLFPSLDIHVASQKDINKYKYFFPYYNQWDNFIKSVKYLPHPPVYIGGYGYDGIVPFRSSIYTKIYSKKIVTSLPNSENQNMLNKINNDNMSVGMHIRRGDLTDGGIYRESIEKDYFLKALNTFSDESTFYFFSDGMEWVKSELLPMINTSKKVVLIDFNGAEYGWCDLLLMSKCRHQIASQGSMGYHAFLLNSYVDKKICIPDKKFAKRILAFNQIENMRNVFII